MKINIRKKLKTMMQNPYMQGIASIGEGMFSIVDSVFGSTRFPQQIRSHRKGYVQRLLEHSPCLKNLRQ